MADVESDLVRASDAEREAVVERLTVAVGEGRLTLEEFSDRVAGVYATRTQSELTPFIRDLPAATASTTTELATSRSTITQAATPTSLQSSPADPGSTPIHTTIGAIKRRGRWRVAGTTTMDVTVGPVKLDFRGAAFVGREVTVKVTTVLGAIKVWVPNGIRVEVHGQTTVGTRTIEESYQPPHVEVPTLHLHLDTVVGTVKVFRV